MNLGNIEWGFLQTLSHGRRFISSRIVLAISAAECNSEIYRIADSRQKEFLKFSQDFASAREHYGSTCVAVQRNVSPRHTVHPRIQPEAEIDNPLCSRRKSIQGSNRRISARVELYARNLVRQFQDRGSSVRSMSHPAGVTSIVPVIDEALVMRRSESIRRS